MKYFLLLLTLLSGCASQPITEVKPYSAEFEECLDDVRRRGEDAWAARTTSCSHSQ